MLAVDSSCLLHVFFTLQFETTLEEAKFSWLDGRCPSFLWAHGFWSLPEESVLPHPVWNHKSPLELAPLNVPDWLMFWQAECCTLKLILPRLWKMNLGYLGELAGLRKA